jgi:LmbE family N-acetylglucosaminyl deacetylase/SAM-dependent methyltransferase
VVSFDHRDAGTPESDWMQAFADHPIDRVELPTEALIVVAAHPDDETLGAAGLMADASSRGVPVHVVVVTDGEASHPFSPTTTPTELAHRRRDELTAALARLSISADPLFLGIPDGATEEHRAVIGSRVARMLDDNATAGALVLAPWAKDGHRDHRVVGEVVEALCGVRAIRFAAYPIWLWHWGDAGDVPWPHLRRFDLDGPTRAAKAAALAEHGSQTRPLSAAPGDEAMLNASMHAHFERSFEVFIAPESTASDSAAASVSVAAEYFDGMYARHDDPWGFDSRWYETRKRRIVLATLPRERYRSGFEAGCSTGALTAELADRCDELLAVDIAAAAVERARRRLAGREGVNIRRAQLPADWPAASFDLVVLSEVAYYWAGDDLERALDAAVRSLAGDGHLVACHWRHPVKEYPRGGDEVHAALAARMDLVRLVRHEEEDFVLEVYGREGARSVAAETGLST